MQEYDGKQFVKHLKQASGEEKGIVIAKKIGVSESTISKWNTGKNIPQIDHLYAIHNAYKCSVDSLLGIDGNFEITPANVCRTLVDLDTHCANSMTITADDSEVTIKLKRPGTKDQFCAWSKANSEKERKNGLEEGKQLANITAIFEFLKDYAKLRRIDLDDMAETVVDSLLGKVNDRADEYLKNLRLNADQESPDEDKRKKQKPQASKRKEDD